MTGPTPRLSGRDAARAAVALARAAREVARARHPHDHPWSYALLVAFLRDQFRDPDPSVERIRERLDLPGALQMDRLGATFVPVSAGGVPAWWVVHPRSTRDVLLYLHGGGYAFGSTRSHAPLVVGLASRTRSRVLSVEYRLAPEHPCPAAIDDVLQAYRWLLAQGEPADRIVFAGDSAGGGLALSAVLAIRDAGLPPPAGVATLSPWTDLAVTGDTVHPHQHTDYLGTPEGLWTFGGYYAGALDRRDPRVSPLYADDLAELPPSLLIAGGAEMVLADSTRMAARLGDSGVDVTLHVEPGEVHVYPMFYRFNPRSRDGLRRVAAFVERVRDA